MLHPSVREIARRPDTLRPDDITWAVVWCKRVASGAGMVARGIGFRESRTPIPEPRSRSGASGFVKEPE